MNGTCAVSFQKAACSLALVSAQMEVWGCAGVVLYLDQKADSKNNAITNDIFFFRLSGSPQIEFAVSNSTWLPPEEL